MTELAIFKKRHMMIDLETLSTHQDATIVQIGAAIFTFNGGIEHEFLINVDPVDSVKRFKTHVEKSTIEWWETQPEEVRNSWKVSPKALDIALIKLNAFIGDDNLMVWSQGAVFDLGVLRNAYEKTGIVRGWKYWDEMDCRTAFNLAGFDNRNARKGKQDHHNALADAISQAKSLIELFST